MQNLDLKKLTAEQRRELLAELAAQEQAEKQKQQQERARYEELKNDLVNESFTKLESMSELMGKIKTEIFGQFQTVLNLKQELYDLSDEQMLTQQSHQFTNEEGTRSIIIGNNVIDRWDETVSVGMDKVNAWLQKISGMNEENKKLVSIIRDLMKPNKDGVLKANRILDLQNKARELGDKELIEAVDLIRESYRPSRTSTYIKAKYKDEQGRDQWLGLSMSSV
jgi:hypothetical protein